MDFTRTLRQFLVAAVVAFSPAAVSAANCNAAFYTEFKACAAAGGAGDTITLTSFVSPDGTPLTVNADQTVINNGFDLTGSGAIVKDGAGVLILPEPNSYSGGTFVYAGGFALGDAASLGSSFIILANGGLLTLGNFSIGAAGIFLGGPTTIAAAAGTTVEVLNATIGVDAIVTLGDPTNNGNILLSSVTAVDSTASIILGGGFVQAGDATASIVFSDSALTTFNATGTLDTNGEVVAIANVTGTGQIVNFTPGAVVFKAGTYGGVISGTGNVGKDSTGMARFTGANTYTGPTLIVAGELRIGDGGTTGDLGNTSGVNIGPVAALVYERSDTYALASTIDGPGNLGMLSGILQLTGTNLYTGPTLIAGGELHLGDGGVTGDVGNTIGINLFPGAALVYDRANAYTLAADVIGDGTLAVNNASGILRLTGNNGYTGPTLVAAGELHIGDGGTSGTLGNTVGVNLLSSASALVYNRADAYALAAPITGPGTLGMNNPTGQFFLAADNSYSGPTLIVAGNLGIGDGGTSGTLGNTSGVSNNGALGFNRTDAYTLAAQIAGTGNVVVINTGTFTLSNTNTYIGPTIIAAAGTLAVTGSIQSSPFTLVDLGGTLQGTGTTGPVLVNTGNLAPGLSPGIINTGNLSLTAASTAQFEIAGPAAGTGYDQINVTGTVNLGGANLLATGGYVPVQGDTIVLVNNDGVDSVVGAFAGIPEGTTSAFNGTLMRISYAGGDGNDVVLSVVTHTVTPSISGSPDGTITPNTPQTVLPGATPSFTVTPNVGYSASVGGTCGPAAGPSSAPINYTTNAVIADCTVVATFTLNSYTVTSSGSNANGTITPPSQSINHGSTAVFTVTPAAGYTASVGGTCPAGSLVGTTYTTGPITGPCDVAATFALNSYTVTSSAGANGSITPPSQTVAHGGTTNFTVTPSAGYSAVMGGTCPAGSLVGTTYTTGVITADCTVTASFTQNTYTVTPSAGANGTIAPNTPQTIAHGATTTFTVTPSTGYTAVVGGTCGGTLVGNTYTTNPITANCTVDATFTQNTYTVTPSAGANGTIAPNTPQTVAHGATTTFTVTPSAGYTAVVGGTCGGTLLGSTYTTSPVTANCTVSATFSATPVTTFSGPSPTGTGTITATVAGVGATCGFGTRQFIPLSGNPASPPAGSEPAGVVFPHGLFDFTVTGCTPGSEVTVTVTYPQTLDPGAQYWKYGPEPGNATPHWYVMPATITGATAVFRITDGGQGDDDLAANGTIVDQGGPGVPPAGGGASAQQTPTMTEWGLIIMTLLMLFTGMGGFRRRAHRGR